MLSNNAIQTRSGLVFRPTQRGLGFLHAVALGMVLTCTVGPKGYAEPKTEYDPVALFAKASPGTVTLRLLAEDEKEVIGTGSGFVIKVMTGSKSADGSEVFTYESIVTCYHVIQFAPYATAQYSDGREGSVWASWNEDRALDLAVVFAGRMELAAVAPDDSTSKPSVLTLYDGPRVPIGTRVFTIGSPKGFSNTLSEGLVSGYREIVPGVERIQITAPISPGSSGGPVLLADGRVLGVASETVVDGQNLNLAIPASDIRKVLARKPRIRELWKGVDVDGELPDARSSFEDGSVECKLPSEWFKDASYTEFRKAFETYPALEKHRFYLTYARASHLLLPKDNRLPLVYAEAAGLLKESTELKPDFAPAYAKQHFLYETVARDYVKALVAAEFLVRLAPNSPEAYRLRCEAFYNLDRYPEAIDDCSRAVKMRPNDAFNHYELASVYNQVDPEEALKSLAKAYELGHPGRYAMYWMRASALVKLGRHKEAVEAYRKCLALMRDGSYPESWIRDIERRLALTQA